MKKHGLMKRTLAIFLLLCMLIPDSAAVWAVSDDPNTSVEVQEAETDFHVSEMQSEETETETIPDQVSTDGDEMEETGKTISVSEDTEAVEEVDEAAENVLSGAEADAADLFAEMSESVSITDATVKDGMVYAAYHSDVDGMLSAKLYEQDSYREAEDTEDCEAAASCSAVEAKATVNSGDEIIALPIDRGTIPEFFYLEVTLTDGEGSVLATKLSAEFTEGIQLALLSDPTEEDFENGMEGSHYISIAGTFEGEQNYAVIRDDLLVIADGESYPFIWRGTDPGQIRLSKVPQLVKDLYYNDYERYSKLKGIVFLGMGLTEFYKDETTAITTSTEDHTNFVAFYGGIQYHQPDSPIPSDNEEENVLDIDFIKHTANNYTPDKVFSYGRVGYDGAYFGQIKDKSLTFNQTIPAPFSPSIDAHLTVNNIEPSFLYVFQGDDSFFVPKLKEDISFDIQFKRPSVNSSSSLHAAEGHVMYNDEDEYFGPFTIAKSGDEVQVGNSEEGTYAYFDIKFTAWSANYKGKWWEESEVKGRLYAEYGLESVREKDGATKVTQMKDTTPFIQTEAVTEGFAAIQFSTEMYLWFFKLPGVKDLPYNNSELYTKQRQRTLVAVEGLEDKESQVDRVHYCTDDPGITYQPGCKNIKEYIEEPVSYDKLQVNGTNVSKEGLFPTQKWSRQYWHSKTYNESGTGECPHMGYAQEVLVTYSDDTPAEGAEVFVPVIMEGDDEHVQYFAKGITDAEGKVKIYLPAGETYDIHAKLENRRGNADSDVIRDDGTNEVVHIILDDPFEIKVEWNDESNQSERRPEKITFKIEEEKDGVWTAQEDTVEVSEWKDDKGSGRAPAGGNLRARIDGDIRELTEGEGEEQKTSVYWYAEDSKDGTTPYLVEYVDEPGEDGKPGSTTVKLTEMRAFTVKKEWDIDAGGNDHPASVEVQLQTTIPYLEEVLPDQSEWVWLVQERRDVSAATEWKAEFNPVPVYNELGKEIKYRVREVSETTGLTVYAEDDKDKAAEVWGDDKNTVTYSVDAYLDVASQKQISKHDTKYQASYETEGDETTITNLAIVDIKVHKLWVMGGEAEKPDSAYIVIQSRPDSEMGKALGLTDKWLPVYDPIKCDKIEILGFEIPFAISEVNEDGNWYTSFTVKKYNSAGILQEFQAIEGISGAIKDAVQWVIGVDLPISFNPLDTYVSTFFPKCIDLLNPSMKFSEIVNMWYKGSDDDENVTVSGMKVWDDNENELGLRPESVTVHLLENGKEIQSFELNEENSWAWMYNEGKEGAKYTVKEDKVLNYSTSYEGLNVINALKLVDVAGEKKWVGDEEAMRPEKITIHLLQDGEEIESREVTAEDDWKWEFTGLLEGSGDHTYEYTVSEDPVEGYETEVHGYDIANIVSDGTMDVEVEKEWVDAENPDLRPKSISVELLANGEIYRTGNFREDNDYKCVFEEVPISDEDGKRIEYTVNESLTESEAELYTVEISGSAATGFTVTNTLIGEKIRISGEKTWEGDTEEIRPESITIRLVADDEEVETKTVTADDEWKWDFGEYPVTDNGREIEYVIYEEEIEDYTATVDGFNVTNEYTPDTISVSVTKVWKDNEDKAGVRPEQIIVTVLREDDEKDEGKTLILNEENEWKGTFEELPEKDPLTHEEISYIVREEEFEGSEHYDTAVEGDLEKGFTITNTLNLTEVSGKKIWVGDDESMRPESITIRLLQDGEKIESREVGTADEWKWTFDGLKERSGEHEYEYTVTEDPVEGYETEVQGYDVVNIMPTGKMDIEVQKVWKDAENSSIRPKMVSVNLLANGVMIQSGSFVATEDYKVTFEGVPISDENGNRIEYTVEEEMESQDAEHYTVEITGSAATGFTVTNSLIGKKISISGEKTWEDDTEEVRPESITIRLLADGEEIDSKEVTAADEWKWDFGELPETDNGRKIEYTITEDEVEDYTTVVDGFNVTNQYTPSLISVTVNKVWEDNEDKAGVRPSEITVRILREDDADDEGRSLVLNETNNWSGTFTELPEKDPKTHEKISYIVTEEDFEGSDDYAVSLEGDMETGFTITNTYVTEQKTMLMVSLLWYDGNNRDKTRWDSAKVTLLANGTETGRSEIVTAKNSWACAFTDLPAYNVLLLAADAAAYSVKVEDPSGKENVYDISYMQFSEQSVVVILKYEPETVTVVGTKTWTGDNEAVRPKELKVSLYAGEALAETVTTSSGQEWKYTFSPQYKNDKDGNEIEYSVKEEVPDGYTCVIHGYDLENIYKETELTSVKVSKVWQDNNDQDGLRTEDVTIYLLADGKKTANLKLSETGAWEGEFKKLPVWNEEGTEKIVYTVEEKTVKGYESSISGNASEGFTVTNTHEPETITVEGKKTWIDARNKYGKRPEAIVIHLLADGKEIEKVTVTATDDWSWTFKDLPKKEAGKTIKYTITEDAVKDYTTYVRGYNVTNCYKDLPPTGDNNDPLLWLLLLGMTVAASCGTILVLQHRRRKE